MKKLLFSLIGMLMAVGAIAQDYSPTVNWPYLYPDFIEGELVLSRAESVKYRFNIHLDLSALHYVEDGKIKEADALGVVSVVIGDDLFRNVGGRMMKVLAEAGGGLVVQEARGNFSAVVRNDGAYGTTALNSTTTKTFLYNENVINQYNGYLLTDVYEDLFAMKEDAETLPVNSNLYLVIGLEQIPANKKSVAALPGMDKKAFSAFLKSEKIIWTDIQDLEKVLDYILSVR